MSAGLASSPHASEACDGSVGALWLLAPDGGGVWVQAASGSRPQTAWFEPRDAVWGWVASASDSALSPTVPSVIWAPEMQGD